MHMQDGQGRPEADGSPEADDDLVTGAEVASYYKVNESTVGRWRKLGRIPSVPKPSGKRYLYPRWLVQDGTRRRDWWKTRGIDTSGE